MSSGCFLLMKMMNLESSASTPRVSTPNKIYPSASFNQIMSITPTNYGVNKESLTPLRTRAKYLWIQGNLQVFYMCKFSNTKHFKIDDKNRGFEGVYGESKL